jgi:hypothetical protein
MKSCAAARKSIAGGRNSVRRRAEASRLTPNGRPRSEKPREGSGRNSGANTVVPELGTPERCSPRCVHRHVVESVDTWRLGGTHS